MGRRLTPLGLLVKWLIVPLALATLGYFLLGPEIGKTPLAKKVGNRLGLPVPGAAEKDKDERAKAEDADLPKKGPEPEVEVSSERVERPRPERRTRRKRRRRRSRSSEPRAQVIVPGAPYASSC